MSASKRVFFFVVLAVLLARAHGAGTSTLSARGVEQVSGTLTTLTTDVTNLATSVATLTTNLGTLTTNVATLQTSVNTINTLVTAIGTTTTNTQTTVNAIAADLTVNIDQVSFIAAVAPIAFSPMAAGYSTGIFGWTSGTLLPWSGAQITVLNFCDNNFATTVWLLDAAVNDADTIAAFSEVVAESAGSLPTAGSYNFLVKYNDVCAGPGFTYGTLVGTCCIDPLVTDYIYNTATAQFTCSDQTTPAFPLCVIAQTGAPVKNNR